MITNKLSPLMQAGVEAGPKTIAGQYITKTEEGFTYDDGQEVVPIQDPDNLLEIDENGLVVDNDYQVEEGESGLIIKGVEVPGGEESAPEMPAGPGPGAVGPGGMGIPAGGVGPMQMQSPTKIYKKAKGKRTEY